MSYQSNPIRRFAEKPTRKTAMDAKCAECVGCNWHWLEPGFRKTIRDCTDQTCPLWAFRPFKGPNSAN